MLNSYESALVSFYLTTKVDLKREWDQGFAKQSQIISKVNVP